MVIRFTEYLDEQHGRVGNTFIHYANFPELPYFLYSIENANQSQVYLVPLEAENAAPSMSGIAPRLLQCGYNAENTLLYLISEGNNINILGETTGNLIGASTSFLGKKCYYRVVNGGKTYFSHVFEFANIGSSYPQRNDSLVELTWYGVGALNEMDVSEIPTKNVLYCEGFNENPLWTINKDSITDGRGRIHTLFARVEKSVTTVLLCPTYVYESLTQLDMFANKFYFDGRRKFSILNFELKHISFYKSLGFDYVHGELMITIGELTGVQSSNTPPNTPNGGIEMQLRAQVLQLQTENQALNSGINDARRETQTSNTQIAQLQTEKNAIGIENNTLRSTIVEKNATIAQLQSVNVTDCGAIVESKNATIAQLQNQITAERAISAQLQTEKNAIGVENNTLRGTIAEKNATIAQLQNQITAERAIVSDLRAQIAVKVTQITALQNQIADLRAQILELQSGDCKADLDAKDVIIARLQTQVIQLQGRITDKDGIIQSARTQIESLEMHIQDLNKVIASSDKSDCESIKTENERLKTLLSENGIKF
jgi:hypothetical protein